MKSKAQIFALDAAIGITVFIVILLSSVWAWDTAREKISLIEARNDLELVARTSASVLMQSPGNPANWDNYTVSDFNTTNIYALGLVKNRQWAIDKNKTIRLMELNSTKYSDIRSILGIKGPGYHFFLNVSLFNRTTNSFQKLAYVGIRANTTADNVVNIERIGWLRNDKNWVRINMQVWRMCSGVTCT